MKERIFTLLLAMIMLMPAMAQEVVDPGWSLNEETGELRIWKDFEDFESSSTEAWRSSKNLIKSVVIEDGVTKIAAYSFYECKSLTSVEIPNSVTSLGDYAFYECSGLTSVVIPNSVTGIGSFAFFGCSGLTSIEIPSSVTNIGSFAFYRCSGLTSVEIPNSVTRIGNSAFNRCSGLTSVKIPNSVMSIENYAFEGCKKLEIVNYTGSMTEWLSIKYVDCGSAFRSNSARLYINGELVTDVIVPEGITQINDHAFCSYKHIKSVIIPNGVTTIGDCAFLACSGLISVEIPNSVTSIGNSAFTTCKNLTTVYTDKEKPTILKSALGTSITYIVPCDFSDELVAKYTNAGMTAKKEWHNFTDYVYNEDASLDADGTETAECDRDGCEATDTRVAEGTKLLPTGVEDVVAEKAKVVKTVENGRIVIIKDGKKYGVTGQILK